MPRDHEEQRKFRIFDKYTPQITITKRHDGLS